MKIANFLTKEEIKIIPVCQEYGQLIEYWPREIIQEAKNEGFQSIVISEETFKSLKIWKEASELGMDVYYPFRAGDDEFHHCMGLRRMLSSRELELLRPHKQKENEADQTKLVNLTCFRLLDPEDYPEIVKTEKYIYDDNPRFSHRIATMSQRDIAKTISEEIVRIVEEGYNGIVLKTFPIPINFNCYAWHFANYLNLGVYTPKLKPTRYFDVFDLVGFDPIS